MKINNTYMDTGSREYTQLLDLLIMPSGSWISWASLLPWQSIGQNFRAVRSFGGSGNPGGSLAVVLVVVRKKQKGKAAGPPVLPAAVPAFQPAPAPSQVETPCTGALSQLCLRKWEFRAAVVPAS